MEYWDAIAPKWDAMLADSNSFANHEESFRRFHWFMKRAVKIGHRTRSFRLLDLGCGTGEASWPLWKLVASVTFFDRSPAMLRLARNKCRKGVFVRGEAAALPFLDAEFDVIVSRGALLSLLPTEALPHFFQHLWRVMRPGAQMLFDFVTNRASFSAVLDGQFESGREVTPVVSGAWTKAEMLELLRIHLPAAQIAAYDGTDRHAMNRILIKK